jgi:5-methylcytosine-specific restriction enzyme subunit McrC
MIRHLILRENDPARPSELTSAEAEALSSAELAIVTRSPGSRGWDVAAGSKVGVVRVGDLQVTVQPKIAIGRLLFMVGYARRPTMWRDLPVELDSHSGLPDALAQAFVYWTRRALEQGLMQGYLTVDESLPVMRGRLRVGEQISRRVGQGLPLEVTYDEFTTDIAENRLLLTAALRLLTMPRASRASRHALQRIRVMLREVTPIGRGAMLPRWTPTRLNTKYQPALQIADLILAGDSFEQRVGDLRVSGFVLDMWKIFEDFVCVALREAMARRGGRSSLQRTLHMDMDAQVTMKPDFLWTGRDGERVVVDAKYKAEKPDGFPNADLYQLLAYCTVLGLKHGHLVYAKGNEAPVEHAVVGTEIRIHCHTLDLAAEPAALLAQIVQLAESI